MNGLALPPVLSFGLALVLTAVLVIPVRRLAIRLGAVDEPGGRRVHDRPTPRMGGAAIFFSLAVVIPVAAGVGGDMGTGLAAFTYPTILLGLAGLLMAMGAMDDVLGLSAWVKLAVQAVVVLIGLALLVGVTPVDFGFWRTPGWLGPLAFLFAFVWVLTITNAYNLVDGLDGLAAGIGAIAATSLAVVAWLNGADLALLALITLVGALLGFLVHNRPPARVFMGDAGTLPVGFLLGILAILATSAQGGGWSFIAAGLALGIPLTDVTLSVFRRGLKALALVRSADDLRERFRLERRGEFGVMSPDRNHLHHRLVALGLSREAAVAVLHIVGLVLAGAAVVATLEPAIAPWLALLAIAGVVFVSVSYLYGELDILRRGLLLPLFDLELTRNRKIHALYDLVAVVVAWGATTILLGDASGRAEWTAVAVTGLVVGALMVGLLRLLRVYRGAYRYIGVWQASRMVAVTFALGLLLGIAGQAWETTTPFPAAFAVLFAFLLTLPLVGARVSFRILDAFYQRRAGGGRPVFIYGAGRSGMMALYKILQDPEVKLEPVGFIDDNEGLRGLMVDGYPVVGQLDELEDLLETHGVFEVILATRRLPPERKERLLRLSREHGFPVREWVVRIDEGVKLGVPSFSRGDQAALTIEVAG